MNKYLLSQFRKKGLSVGVDLNTILIDEIQMYFLEEFFKNPASSGAILFGGGRYRHINRSIRFSVDLDFFKTKGFNLINVTSFIKNNFIGSLAQKFEVSARITDIPPWERVHNIETLRLLIYDTNSDFNQIYIDFDFIMREPAIKYDKALVA